MDSHLEQQHTARPAAYVPSSPATARFRSLIILTGFIALVAGAVVWSSADLLKFLAFLAVSAMISSARATSPSSAAVDGVTRP